MTVENGFALLGHRLRSHVSGPGLALFSNLRPLSYSKVEKMDRTRPCNLARSHSKRRKMKFNKSIKCGL